MSDGRRVSFEVGSTNNSGIPLQIFRKSRACLDSALYRGHPAFFAAAAAFFYPISATLHI